MLRAPQVEQQLLDEDLQRQRREHQKKIEEAKTRKRLSSADNSVITFQKNLNNYEPPFGESIIDRTVDQSPFIDQPFLFDSGFVDESCKILGESNGFVDESCFFLDAVGSATFVEHTSKLTQEKDVVIRDATTRDGIPGRSYKFPISSEKLRVLTRKPPNYNHSTPLFNSVKLEYRQPLKTDANNINVQNSLSNAAVCSKQITMQPDAFKKAELKAKVPLETIIEEQADYISTEKLDLKDAAGSESTGNVSNNFNSQPEHKKSSAQPQSMFGWIREKVSQFFVNAKSFLWYVVTAPSRIWSSKKDQKDNNMAANPVATSKQEDVSGDAKIIDSNANTSVIANGAPVIVNARSLHAAKSGSLQQMATDEPQNNTTPAIDKKSSITLGIV